MILQAVLDAKGKFGTVVTQVQAKIWLEARGGIKSEFATVCKLAGIDFERTRKRCVELLDDNAETIDFRMMKQDRPHNRTAKNRRRYYRRMQQNEWLKRERERVNVEAVIFNNYLNDNIPAAANDNVRTEEVDNLNNQLTRGDTTER